MRSRARRGAVVIGLGLGLGLGLAGCVSAWVPQTPSNFQTVNYTPHSALDVYLPNAAGPYPVVVWIHGGGWTSGDRRNGAFLAGLRGPLLRAGIAVVSIDYRLAPGTQWPGQLEDVNAALRYIETMATTAHFDANRISIVGESAGAHLALLAALRDDRPLRAKAVVDLFGPTDLSTKDFLGNSSESARRYLMGPLATNRLAVADASPINHLSSDDPDILVVHGDIDATVPVLQSRTFVAAAEAKGVKVTYLEVVNGGHGLQSLTENPSRGKLTELISAYVIAALTH